MSDPHFSSLEAPVVDAAVQHGKPAVVKGCWMPAAWLLRRGGVAVGGRRRTSLEAGNRGGAALRTAPARRYGDLMLTMLARGLSGAGRAGG